MSDVNRPSDEQLAAMSREELLELGGKLDGVDIILKEPRWPVEGTKAEKRAERLVPADVKALGCGHGVCWRSGAASDRSPVQVAVSPRRCVWTPRKARARA